MRFNRKRGVSPIIATLLLIAIAVAAGIIVYVYVNSLAGGLTSGGGQQVAAQVQLEAYSFNAVGTGSGQVIDIFLKNVGGASVTISAIYIDGTAMVEWGTLSSNYATTLMIPNSVQSCFAAVSSAVTYAIVNSGTQTNSGGAATCTGQASATCSNTNPCFTTSPVTPAEKLTLAAQDSTQILVGLDAAVTAGTSHTVKIITSTGGQSVFSVTAGRSG